MGSWRRSWVSKRSLLNTTQTGGTETVTGNSGAFEGFLFITDPTNDPTLTLESNATLNSRGLVIGSLVNETGNLVIQGGSSLINTTSTPGGSGANIGNLVSGGQAHLGLLAGTTGNATVTGPGSLWENSSVLFVGNSGTGTLSIQNGGVVTNTVGDIGGRAGSTGTVTVSDSNSRWENSNALFVGDLGTGTLSIQNGGVVTNTVGSVANNEGSIGTVTVTGPNSQWQNSSDLRVGFRGTGMLSIENGGTVSSSGGSIGNRATGSGTVNVTGAGSQWRSQNTITVGQSGSGNLSIQDGGIVTIASSQGSSLIGSDSGSIGEVIVTGAGSLWQSNGSLQVGLRNGSMGTLLIENGGVVRNKDGFVAAESGSVGMVNITGANSHWQNNGSLIIGSFNGGSNGTVTVADGGLVSVDGIFSVGQGSTLNVNAGGTLSLAAQNSIINNGAINGQFNANGRRILGSGTFSDLNVGDGAIVSPGNSPGSLITSNTQWGDNGTYEWELAELDGEAGMDWDLWNANNLDILSDGAFTIQIRPIDDMSNLTALADWDPTQNYSWLIATSTNAGFTDASLLNLVLDYSNFETFHDLAGGSFNLNSMDGNNSLYLDFNTSGVPEPTTLMMFGTGLVGLIYPRRRKSLCLES